MTGPVELLERVEKTRQESRPWGGITREERRWALGFAGFIILLTSMPYLLGYSFQNRTWQFTGLVFGVEDGNSYIAKMLNGAAGDWLFFTPYTAEPQRGVMMFLPYILLGKLAAGAGLHDQLVALFHLFRVAAILMETLAAYEFMAFFVQEAPWRRLGTALAALGGGLGWVLVIQGHSTWLNSLPLDFISPETFGFLGIYGLPHLALGRAGLLWALVTYLRASRGGGGWRPVLGLSGWWLLAGIALPLELALVGFVIGLHLAALALRNWSASRRVEEGAGNSVSGKDWARWRYSLRLAVAAGLAPGAYLVYLAWATLSDPYLQVWSAQNAILSPHPLHYLLAYGLLLPLAWLGGRRLRRRDPWQGWLVVAWALALPLLAYLPTNLQRRLPEGGWVALSTLAVAGVDGLLPLAKRVQQAQGNGAMPVSAPVAPTARKSLLSVQALALLPILLTVPSTVIILASGILGATSLQAPVFRSANEVAAFQHLAQNAPHRSVVLASYETGNALPAWAPVRVIIGHGPESAGGAQRSAEIAAIYSRQMISAQRQAWLRKWEVAYVWWGPDEKALGSWNPGQETYLRQIYPLPSEAGGLESDRTVQIFQVLPDRLRGYFPTP